jgi:hypothetical protein
MVAIATYSAWHKNGGMALDEEEKHSVVLFNLWASDSLFSFY